jgi:circadian clock protein KaiC
MLDHRVTEQIATRNLRVVKYRGALHGTNEFPFLIGDEGISVLPITSLGLNHKISGERIATGIPRLDAMLGGRGFFRGSSILLTARPASARPSSAPLNGLPRRRKSGALLLVRESPNQIIRNMIPSVAPGAVGQARLAAVPRGAADALRRNAPGHDVQRDARFNPPSSSWTRLPA